MAVRIDADADQYSRTAGGFPTSTLFSATTWARIETAQNFSTVWNFDDQGTHYAYIQTDQGASNLVMTYFESNNAVTRSIAGPTMTLGRWYFFALIKNGTTVDFYWALDTDPALTTAGITNGISPNAFTRQLIGESKFGAEDLNGMVGPTIFWSDVALNVQEIREQRWYAYPVVKLERAHQCLPFDQRVGLDVDILSSRRNITPAGTPTVADGPRFVHWCKPNEAYRPDEHIYNTPIKRMFLSAAVSAFTLTADSGSFSWSGIAASIYRLLIAAAGVFTWTGTNALLSRLLITVSGSYLWTGTAATLSLMRKIIANAGSYLWTGTVASIYRILFANAGSYLWTGTSATLTLMRKIIADIGSYLWTGTAATLFKSFVFAAASGVFNWTGSTAALKAARLITGLSGSFTWTGTAASIYRILFANAGSYLWTGTAATLSLMRKIIADVGSYIWTGTAASLLAGKKIVASSGSYLWTGAVAALRATRRIVADSGVFSWVGTVAALTFSGAQSIYHFLPRPTNWRDTF